MEMLWENCLKLMSDSMSLQKYDFKNLPENMINKLFAYSLDNINKETLSIFNETSLSNIEISFKIGEFYQMETSKSIKKKKKRKKTLFIQLLFVEYLTPDVSKIKRFWH